MQAVLLTVTGGKTITGQPAEPRIQAEYSDVRYLDAVKHARALRLTAWWHPKTGEVRIIADTDLVGCAFRDTALFDWLGPARMLTIVSYAIVVDRDSVDHYVSTPATA